MKRRAIQLWQKLFEVEGCTVIKKGRGYSLKFQAKGFKGQPVIFEVPLSKFKESPTEFIRAYMKATGWDIVIYNPNKKDWQAVVNHVIDRSPLSFEKERLCSLS